MRKLLFTMAMTAFLCSGCAWMGFGDDESVTAQAEPAASESTVVVNNETEQPAVQETKTTAKGKKASKAASKKSEAQIRADLDRDAKLLVAQSARTLLPNKANKDVKQVGGQWVATYISVDTENIRTEMRTSASGHYVGSIRYHEDIMECRGATKAAALAAPCTKVRTRNMNELVSYNGSSWK